MGRGVGGTERGEWGDGEHVEVGVGVGMGMGEWVEVGSW